MSHPLKIKVRRSAIQPGSSRSDSTADRGCQQPGDKSRGRLDGQAPPSRTSTGVATSAESHTPDLDLTVSLIETKCPHGGLSRPRASHGDRGNTPRQRRLGPAPSRSMPTARSLRRLTTKRIRQSSSDPGRSPRRRTAGVTSSGETSTLASRQCNESALVSRPVPRAIVPLSRRMPP